MGGIELRPFEAGDLPAITAIYREAVLNGTASFEIDPPDEQEMARRAAFLIDGGFSFWVAHAPGARCLGYAYAGPYRARPAYRFTVEDSIYLADEARGKGIGSRLLAALIEESTARGFRQMIAVIGDSANAPSIDLHRRHGFRMTGVALSTGFAFCIVTFF